MNPNYEDPRIIRSREALLAAMANELRKKSLSEISITGICRNAGVDRATFYRHFEDKQDLIERGIAQHIDHIIGRIGADDKNSSQFKKRLDSLFVELDEHRESLRPFFSISTSAIFEDRIKTVLFDFLLHNRIEEIIFNSCDNQEKKILPKAITAMTSSALFGLIKYWLSEKPEWEPHYISVIYQQYISAGIISFL